jgi:hypothetical protein
VAELRERIEKIDSELLSWAEKHLAKVSLQNGNTDDARTAADLAESLVREQDAHAWFEDELDLDARYEPCFKDEDIATVRNARRILRPDLTYLRKVLPSLSDLPDAARLAGLHQDLVGAAELEHRLTNESFPVLSITVHNAAARAEAVLPLLEEIIEFFDVLSDHPWSLPNLRNVATQWTRWRRYTSVQRINPKYVRNCGPPARDASQRR